MSARIFRGSPFFSHLVPVFPIHRVVSAVLVGCAANRGAEDGAANDVQGSVALKVIFGGALEACKPKRYALGFQFIV